MSRFANLEFEEKKSPENAPAQGEPTRDKYYYRDRGATAWLAADYENALSHYSRSLQEENTFYDGWFGQLRMLVELGEYPEAMVWADKALEMFPAHHELLSAKAVTAFRDAEPETAQALTDSAIEMANPTSYVWIVRAEIILPWKAKMAETCVQNALNVAGNDTAVVQLQAGRVLAGGKDYRAALPLLSAAAGDLPDSALAWYELGLCQSALGFDQAKDTLSQCLTLRPAWVEAKEALNRAGQGGGFLSWFRRKR